MKETVGQFAGVRSVEASADTKQSMLAYDPATMDLAQVEAALAEEGYPVRE